MMFAVIAGLPPRRGGDERKRCDVGHKELCDIQGTVCGVPRVGAGEL